MHVPHPCPLSWVSLCCSQWLSELVAFSPSSRISPLSVIKNLSSYTFTAQLAAAPTSQSNVEVKAALAIAASLRPHRTCSANCEVTCTELFVSILPLGAKTVLTSFRVLQALTSTDKQRQFVQGLPSWAPSMHPTLTRGTACASQTSWTAQWEHRAQGLRPRGRRA